MSDVAQPAKNEGNRRRSSRVMLVIPVEVKWMTKDGPWVQEHADTEVVSQHGAMLKMKSRPSAGTQMEVRRPSLGQSVKVKVVGMGNPAQDGFARVAVEMLVPSDTFWGISFPPQADPAPSTAKPLMPPAKTAKGQPLPAAKAPRTSHSATR